MNEIILNNVETHNLKKININIPKNKITAIYGRSGAGKSSLAFSTLYKLSKDEFDSLENGFSEQGDYILKSYSGLIPAISISQNNFNFNPKSTIYSYLRFANLLVNNKKDLIPDFKYLKINSPRNVCEKCNGLGFVSKVKYSDLIKEDLSISEKPFLCWNNNLSHYYNNLLLAYCHERKIPIDIPFKKLNESQRKEILCGKSDIKLKFSFKHNGKVKQKTAYYIGVIDYANSLILDLKNTSVPQIKEICIFCNGSKIKKEIYDNNLIFGMEFTKFITLPIDEIILFIKDNEVLVDDLFFKTLCSISYMGLGYLSLNRSIPSLSGGELQKLNFSRILNSDISGVLIVIDEISSQLGESNFPIILDKIKKISKNNTVVLVEHEQYFIDSADLKIHIGKYAGEQGGFICSDELIKSYVSIKQKNKIFDFFKFINLSKNNIKNQNVSIPKKCLTCFVGVSGSGKSSLAKSIDDLGGAYYISQKISNYTSRSVLASTIKINTLIAEYFSNRTNVSSDKFLFNKSGGCLTCLGTGVIKYERGYEKDIYVICSTCEGKLFNEKDPDVLIDVNGRNIIEIYQQDISSLISYFEDLKIKNVLSVMEKLCLGHLRLNRKTQTLSGGELRRIKLSEHLMKQRNSEKILIIDEPTAGLDPETSSKIASFLYEKASSFGAIIIIEHKKEVIEYCDYKVLVGPGSGELGGKILLEEVIPFVE